MWFTITSSGAMSLQQRKEICLHGNFGNKNNYYTNLKVINQK